MQSACKQTLSHFGNPVRFWSIMRQILYVYKLTVTVRNRTNDKTH